MYAVEGWVSRISGSALEIRLRTGPRITIPRRNNLRWGESVRVFYDYEKMKPGEVLSLDELALMGSEEEITWGEEDLPWEEDWDSIIDSL